MATVLTRTFDPLTLEILWNRLIATVDEMAAVLVRTSFSTVVGAANDFGCEIMDADGRSLGHATRSMPVFNRTMPNVTRETIKKYGRENMRPANVSDIGGVLNDNLAREAYEEGLFIPLAHFFKAGEVNDVIVDFLRWNVRV